jgi:hypothetical protein
MLVIGALLSGLVLAACSSDTAAEETGAVGTETGVAAPDTGGSELVALLEPVEGTCAEELDTGSAQSLACRWIADADVAVCPSFTQGLLEELFGGSREGCEVTIGRLEPAEDKSAVVFEDVRKTDGGAAMTVRDRPRAATYELTFVFEDDSWKLDTVRTVRVSRSRERTETRKRDPKAETEIANLILRWYRDVDPSVCDSMTDEMLDFGWAKTGNAGRKLCKENVGKAEPLVDVTVRRPLVNGDKAKAKVLYTQGDERLIDEIRLVREDGAWLINTVRLTGFAP